MRIYIFVDLDDTLFQTRRKAPPGTPLYPAALDRQGAPLSFMTPKQRALAELLLSRAYCIPTTARSYSAFRRTLLSFKGPAIIDVGVVILDDWGLQEPQWQGQMRPQLEQLKPQLQKFLGILEEIRLRRQLAVYTRLVSDFEMDLYLVTKQQDPQSKELEILYRELAPHFPHPDFYLHFNDNNLAIVPRCLEKKRAVKYMIDYLRQRWGEEILTIGFGDSRSDLGFMSCCDYALSPNNGQLMTLIREKFDV